MSCSTTVQELTMLTKEMMMREGIEEYDLNIKGHTKRGENFLGDVTFFTIVPKEEKEEYNLVMKTAKRSEELRKKVPVGLAYKRESFMYRVIFPEMRKFLKATGNLIQLDYVPKVYSVCDEETRETLILENLNFLGYRSWDRKKPMNLEHVLLVLEKIGKHHAVGIAMRKKAPQVFEEITKNLTDVWSEFSKFIDVHTFYKPLIENACQLLENSGREDLAKLYNKTIANNILPILHPEIPPEDRFVICHGDCWNNNILFKYKNSDDLHPSEICFVDFQLSMLDSPIKDLSYFIYTSCDKSVLDNTDLLLRTYLASMSETLKILGCKPDDCVTYDELILQWKKYASFGLILSTLIIKAELFDNDEAPDMKELVEAGQDIINGWQVEMKNVEIYNKRILDVFTHFGEKFL